LVINYLATSAMVGAQGESSANFRPLGLVDGGEGEGEGDVFSVPAPLGALMEAPRDGATTSAAAGQSVSSSGTADGSPHTDTWWLLAPPSEAQRTLRKIGSSSVDVEAADDLFALLGAKGDR